MNNFQNISEDQEKMKIKFSVFLMKKGKVLNIKIYPFLFDF